MIRVIFALLAFISIFWFPYPLTLALLFAAGLFVPWLPLALGVLTDILYFVPEASLMPLGTVFGVLICAAAFFVRYILKTRIMS